MAAWRDELAWMETRAKQMADDLERVVEGLTEMGRLFDEIGWSPYEMCDCGHRRAQHKDPRIPGRLPGCMAEGCYCDGFDCTLQRADAFLQEHSPVHRAMSQQPSDLAAERARRGRAS